MKRFILILALVFAVFSAQTVIAGPFVVSDEFEIGVVDKCIVDINGNVTEVAPTTVGNSARCQYDVGNLMDGDHTITIATKNMWGATSPVPLEFTKALPPEIRNLRLEP